MSEIGIQLDKDIYVPGEPVCVTATATLPESEMSMVNAEIWCGEETVIGAVPVRRAPRVAAGYYIVSNGNPALDARFPAARWTAQTRYAGFSQAAGAQLPPTGWVRDFLARGGWLNLVLELKSYAAGNAMVGAQTIVVEGRSYSVPAQEAVRHPDRSTAAPMWSYSQVLDGDCDGLLHRSLAAIRSVLALVPGARINVQLDSEIDTTNQYGIKVGGTTTPWAAADAQAAAACAYMIEWMKNPPSGIAPVPARVTFSTGHAGQWSEIQSPGCFERLHPEWLPIDYVMQNCYNHSANWTPYDRLMEMQNVRYATCGPIMRAKQAMIAEFGSRASYPGSHAAYLAEWPAAVNEANVAAMRRGDGPYVMTNWFGSNSPEWGKVPDSEKAAFFEAMGRAYSTSPFLLP